MKRLIPYISLHVLAFLLIPSLVHAQTRTVAGEATGKYYNDVWKKWDAFPIRVYVDIDGNSYVMGGESLLMARGLLRPKERAKVIALLKKSTSWAESARKDKVEITKSLGDFMKGEEFTRHGVVLTFFSANEGRQTDVILSITDFDNSFSKLELYLDQDQVKQLVALLEKVPATLKEL